MNDTSAVVDGYKIRVRNLLERGIPTFVENASAPHASVIMAEMIAHAKFSFYAYAHRMSSDVWNDNILSALQDANSRNVSVRIMVDDNCEDVSSGRLAMELRPLIRRIPDSAIKPRNHFSVVDGRVVRLETDSEKRTAWFSANDPKVAGEVERKFKTAYLKGVPCAC